MLVGLGVMVGVAGGVNVEVGVLVGVAVAVEVRVGVLVWVAVAVEVGVGVASTASKKSSRYRVTSPLSTPLTRLPSPS